MKAGWYIMKITMLDRATMVGLPLQIMAGIQIKPERCRILKGNQESRSIQY